MALGCMRKQTKQACKQRSSVVHASALASVIILTSPNDELLQEHVSQINPVFPKLVLLVVFITAIESKLTTDGAENSNEFTEYFKRHAICWIFPLNFP